MSISRDDVRHVALLARLKLSDDDIEYHTAHLARIIDYVNMASELDTSDVEPTFQVQTDSCNVMRDDEDVAGLQRNDVLAAAPDHNDEQYIVPPVIADE